MFTQKYFAPVSSPGNSDSPNVWTYRTDDPIDEVKADGYFVDKSPILHDGDFINIQSGGDNFAGYFIKTESSLTVKMVGIESDFENSLLGSSYADQGPTELDTIHQIEFGKAQGSISDTVSLDASGNISINKDGIYRMGGTFSVSRSSAPGVVYIFIRITVNGIQLGNAIAAQIDDNNMTIPLQFTLIGAIAAGMKIKIEMYRDSAGKNNGNLESFTSTIGWGDSPSAAVRVDKLA